MKGRGLLLFSTILVLCSCYGEQQAAGKEEESLVADMTCGLDATAAGGNTYGTDCKGLYDMHSNSDFFPEIPYVKYEGPASENPLSYKWYNAEEVILGKKMKVCTYSQMAHVVGCLNTYVNDCLFRIFPKLRPSSQAKHSGEFAECRIG
jgi:hypothetical protein